MHLFRKIVVLAALILLTGPTRSAWAASSIAISGQLPSGYSGAVFYSRKGYVTNAKVTGKKFSVSVAKSEFKGGSIVLLETGMQYGGAVVLGQKGTKSFLQFGSPSSKKVALGAITISSKGYPKLKKLLASSGYDSKAYATTSLLGSPLGLNSQSTSSRAIHARASTGDTDHDGVPDGVDVDSDGDGSVDGLTTGATSTTQAPYMVIRESMATALNVQANGIPSQSAIDAVLSSGVGTEFSMGFAFSVRDNVTSITGAHVVCDDANTLCGRTSGVATVNNESQSLWKDYHPNGSTYPGLELASSNPSETFFNTGISPHVGPSGIQPGDAYRIEYTGSSGSVIRSQMVAVSPYLVTVPALHAYTANGVDHEINYTAISSEAGASSDNTITIGNDGLLTVHFWRPQRQRLGGTDGSGYVDVGHLRYGIVVMGPAFGGGSSEKSCAGLYSSLSSTLSDHASGQPNDFWPIVDAADDSTPDVANLMSFTVDLKTCINNAGYTSGAYRVSLQASGPDLGHGANRSGEDFYVTIP